jgi:hypothetical protein
LGNDVGRFRLPNQRLQSILVLSNSIVTLMDDLMLANCCEAIHCTLHGFAF